MDLSSAIAVEESEQDSQWHVLVSYGPKFAFGIPQHQYQRIKYAVRQLKMLGFKVTIEKTNFLNRVTFEMCEKIIFMCDIRNLKFNMEMEHDVVARRAVDALLEAREALIAKKELERTQHVKSIFEDPGISVFFEIIQKDESLKMRPSEQGSVVLQELNLDRSDSSEILLMTEYDEALPESPLMKKSISAELYDPRQYDPKLYPSISTSSTIVEKISTSSTALEKVSDESTN